MKTVVGNLIDLAESGEFDVIVHGCNCFCVMGSGIAKEIKQRYPEAYAVDCLTTKGSRDKLGKYTSHGVMTNLTPDEGHHFTIVNGYTQWKYGIGQDFVNYQAMEELFERVAADFDGLRIAYPKIGAGNGGGNWFRISRIIDWQLRNQDHTLVMLEE